MDMDSRLEILVKSVNADNNLKFWKDKLNDKLCNAGYDHDKDRPQITSFINFGKDVLLEYHDYCNHYAKKDTLPPEDEILYIAEIILASVQEWQIFEFTDGKKYQDMIDDIIRQLKDKLNQQNSL